jgi:hypothetical protein
MAKVNGKTVQFWVQSSDDITMLIVDGQIEGTISCSNPVIEATDKNDTARALLGNAVPSYTIDLTIHQDAEDAGQDRVRSLISSGGLVTVSRYDSGASTSQITGYIESYSESLTAEDVVTATCTIQLTGDASGLL